MIFFYSARLKEYKLKKKKEEEKIANLVKENQKNKEMKNFQSLSAAVVQSENVEFININIFILIVYIIPFTN